jgi:predicted ATPase
MKQFLAFRLDPGNQCLWRDVSRGTNERILLTPKAFSVLQHLIAHAGSLVTQDELLNSVWPNTYVQPEVLKYQVADIRSALGDNAKSPTYIETVQRRGYRFVAPVTDVIIGGPRSTERTVPIVVRDEPLSELHACLKRMLEGERQVVFITGEPGIGKTALADEFQRRAASEVKNIHIARGQCIEGYGGKEPYYALLMALSQLCSGDGGESIFRVLVDRAPAWAVQFPALLSPEDRSKLQRELVIGSNDRMLREICEVMEILTGKFPLLVVLEDVQWAHPACVDFISAVGRGRAQARLMLVATKRPLYYESSSQPLRVLRQELVSHHLCCEIALQALTKDEVAEYLASRLEVDQPPPCLAEVVYSRSEGNPLFITAMLEHLRQQGYLRKQNGAWEIDLPQNQVEVGVPENIRELIESRISSLTPPEQRVLEAASIMGSPFSSTVSASATSMSGDAFDEICESLTRRRQIIAPAGISRFPDGTVSPSYNFVHELYREVLYNRQPQGRRAKSHRLIGERLERAFGSYASEVAGKLAYHFDACGDLDQAIKYLQALAETAVRRHSPQTALATLHHALGLCSALPESERAVNEATILEKLASVVERQNEASYGRLARRRIWD